MIFQYSTRKLNGLDYICGSRLISENGLPIGPLEFTKALSGGLFDSKGKLQWTIRENSDYDPKTDHIDNRYIIECDPIQPTVEELKAKKQAAVRNQLVTDLPDILLQNKDNPEALVQALCDRVKEIEVEITNDHKRDPEPLRP